MPAMSAKAVYGLARGVGLTHDQAVTATAIARAESGWDPHALGDVRLQDATWGPSVGLWQIRSVKAQRGTGGTRDASHLQDPRFNARSMYAISGGGHSWTPWTAYTSGAYRAHLATVQRAVGHGDGIPQGRPPRGTTTVDTAGYPYVPHPWTPAVPDDPEDIPGVGAVLGVMGDVRALVLTAAVVSGGVLLVLAGAAATARGKD